MDTPQGLFKVNSTKKGGSIVTPGENSGQDSMDFNEYNCVGANLSSKDGDDSIDQHKKTHDQLSAQLQANRYLCKFHL